MSSTSQPVILLVPGAFGTPAGYDALVPYLEEAGFATQPGAYPSCSPAEPSAATCANDIAALRDTILGPLVEKQHRDVVILAHSYGGIVAGGAAKNLDKQTRTSQGQAGGVVGLIYVAGNIALENESLSESLGGGDFPPFIKMDKVRTRCFGAK